MLLREFVQEQWEHKCSLFGESENNIYIIVTVHIRKNIIYLSHNHAAKTRNGNMVSILFILISDKFTFRVMIYLCIWTKVEANENIACKHKYTELQCQQKCWK